MHFLRPFFRKAFFSSLNYLHRLSCHCISLNFANLETSSPQIPLPRTSREKWKESRARRKALAFQDQRTERRVIATYREAATAYRRQALAFISAWRLIVRSQSNKHRPGSTTRFSVILRGLGRQTGCCSSSSLQEKERSSWNESRAAYERFEVARIRGSVCVPAARFELRRAIFGSACFYRFHSRSVSKWKKWVKLMNHGTFLRWRGRSIDRFQSIGRVCR